MSMLDNIANRFDSLQAMDSARIRVGAWVVVIGLLGHEPAERVRSIRPRPHSRDPFLSMHGPPFH